MTGYVYTLDLGETYGVKLLKLAAFASYDDREAFAAMLLRHAIEEMEARMETELNSPPEGDPQGPREGDEKHQSGAMPSGGIDDDIPF